MPKVTGEDKYECDCGCGAIAWRFKENRYKSGMPKGWIRVETAPATPFSTSGMAREHGFATVSCFRAWAEEVDFEWAEP